MRCDCTTRDQSIVWRGTATILPSVLGTVIDAALLPTVDNGLNSSYVMVEQYTVRARYCLDGLCFVLTFCVSTDTAIYTMLIQFDIVLVQNSAYQ